MAYARDPAQVQAQAQVQAPRPRAWHIPVPFAPASAEGLGLGDVIARMTNAIGIAPCPPCEARKRWLNARVRLVQEKHERQ